MAFDKKSCVFIVSNDTKGKIIRISKSVTTIFGYSPFEIENNYFITNLMPATYASMHPIYMNQFILTG